MNEVQKFLQEKLPLQKGDSIVVAVSGGPDSMCLLYLTSLLQEKLGIHVICAHVNHSMRKESEEEKVFVESFCKKHNIIFEYMKIEEYGEENFHKQARQKRYVYFEKIIKKYKARYLFTAHHGDDLMETILMRIVRGSSLKGYSGFSKITNRDFYQIVRPFIEITKKDILKYNEENHIDYALDASNLKDVYTRNRFRKYVVTPLKTEKENVHEQFYRYSKTLLEYETYIEKEVEAKVEKICINSILDIKKYLQEEPLLQKRILAYLLEKFYGEDLYKITDVHIEELQKLLHSEKANGEIHLPDQKIGRKAYMHFTLEEASKEESTYKIELKDFLSLPNKHHIEMIKESEDTSNFVCRLQSSELKLPLYVRNRHDGDKMRVKGMTGTKKIADIFIDKKIEVKERKSYPIITDADDQIIWLPGLKKTQFDKPKEEKYDIILKYY
ncbi:MAG: tRNA lysidine(34) synthetase TilS [Bacilli bacterium]|nr:tRNA lysidine(34) synthetase TilS [Bacilli bacterium]